MFGFAYLLCNIIGGNEGLQVCCFPLFKKLINMFSQNDPLDLQFMHPKQWRNKRGIWHKNFKQRGAI